MPPPSLPEAALLVIGYGNTVRQDDQAGPLVAERIAALDLPGVCTLACAQLSPEHAEVVALAQAVVFVDAQAGPDRHINLQPVLPGDSSQVTTHAVEPQTLLALARDVFGQAPKAWLLTIPAELFGFGTDLSPLTQQCIEQAVSKVLEMAPQPKP
ncbi:MAG: hydrogenase maturation protease [Verrucomicrobia bacterium]|nr:hydrogenase maturation protease [Verrucomicrobiota bacterium]